MGLTTYFGTLLLALVLTESKKTYLDGSCLILVSYKVAPVHESKLLFSFL